MIADGSAWSLTPSDRTGLFAQSIVVDASEGLAALEKRPAVLRATDPLPFALGVLGLADGAPALPAAPSAPDTSSWTEKLTRNAALIGAGLVVLALGAWSLVKD